MARILAVGNATLDIINIVERYPLEDQEVRAQSQQLRRGGNSANTLVVLGQLGHQCTWAGTLAAEPDADIIRNDLKEYDIDLSAVRTVDSGKVPTSYVTLSRETGSRTIVHYRDLPEYRSEDFARIDLKQFDWIHFEGRNLEEVKRMLKHVRCDHPDINCSLEAEKVRPGIESLFSEVQLLMFSREFALHYGCRSADAFLLKMAEHGLGAEMSCTWGEKGAYAITQEGQLLHAPAYSPAKVVDTLGAGDVFNAGLINQRVQGHNLDLALKEATKLAGKKCGVYGLNHLLE